MIQKHYSPMVSVFAPIVVLSAIFSTVLYFLYLENGPQSGLQSSYLIGGALAYCAAVLLLARLGLNNITKLQQLGLTDSLSQLPNRRALHKDAATIEIEGGEIALAMIDLDGFKSVNDQYGHFIGDRLIKDCAEALIEVCGEEARVYRLGGDEFALLKAGPQAGNILEGLCRKLLARMSRPFYIDERAIIIGASVGLARSSAAAPLPSSELLRRTDVAMYVSKHAGKMRCTWFNEEFDRNREALQTLDGELREALAQDQFSVHYQPLIDATTRHIVAVEALLRWVRPDGRQIGPHLFIPVAEESGLIDAIGLWVLRQACTDARDWDGIKLSVNVSAVQLRNPEFPIELGTLLEELAFPPERLELEITETHILRNTSVVKQNLDVLRGFGVQIVLDDFGTGYASIGFLRQFDFQKLKIDRSLVVDATIDGASRTMMGAIVAVARSLRMDVTAEGVETRDQADLARAAGCDQIQGWLYYKAMPAGEITERLNVPLEEGDPGTARSESMRAA